MIAPFISLSGQHPIFSGSLKQPKGYLKTIKLHQTTMPAIVPQNASRSAPVSANGRHFQFFAMMYVTRLQQNISLHEKLYLKNKNIKQTSFYADCQISISH